MTKLTKRAVLAAGIVGSAAMMLPLTALAEDPATKAPADVYCYIIWPNDHEVLRSGSIWVRFGLRGMGIAPAGVEMENTGHHHLYIDVDEPMTPAGEYIPADKKHLHFGGGLTETHLDLPPGVHTLQLVLSDGKHRAFDPPIFSKKITVRVLR